MAPKSSPSSACFLTLFLVLTGSAAIGRAERLQPEVAAGCWKEIYEIPNCLFSIIDAFISIGGSIEVGVGVPCCAAFLSLTGDCQVEIFQNSSVITLIEVFCEAIVGSAPPEDGGDLPWSLLWPLPLKTAAATCRGRSRSLRWRLPLKTPAETCRGRNQSLPWPLPLRTAAVTCRGRSRSLLCLRPPLRIWVPFSPGRRLVWFRRVSGE
ncbi:unnamed protein product [Linum trigynum]|uniref:Prolamin-like domain-containing protein n=1 Tax=Linum trigynum TaxID=586398 RepID=A0AAV2GWB7_9ROSI